MKVVNIAYAMIKLQFKLPQTLISRGFTRRTVLHAPAFQQKGINRLYQLKFGLFFLVYQTSVAVGAERFYQSNLRIPHSSC